jgi:hypothetical protein
MKLRNILSSLYVDAYQHPGKLYHVTLRNGLIIGMRYSKRKFTLYISRYNINPSFNEWKTVIDNLNPAIKPISTTPQSTHQNNYYYKYLNWDLE